MKNHPALWVKTEIAFLIVANNSFIFINLIIYALINTISVSTEQNMKAQQSLSKSV
jgi:hypothetical protein